MSYINKVPAVIGSGFEMKIDERQFAVDLAKALGGNVEANTFQNESVYVIVDAGGGLSNKLYIRADNHKKRINIGISATELQWGQYDPARKDQRTESISLNPDARPMASMAKDIKKRAIEANLPALAAQRAWKAAKDEAKASVQDYAAQLRAAGLRVDLRDGAESANVSAPGVYISARLESYGKVAIDRIESLPIDKFLAVMAIISNKESA